MSKKTQKESAKPSSSPKTGGERASRRPSKSDSGKKTGLLMEGDPAPPFLLPQAGGGQISLADFAGQNLVLFFYPRAGTPGCTIEAADFSRLSEDFLSAQTALLGVSADPVKAIEAFHKRNLLRIPLVTDEVHSTLKAYGVWEKKSMYGRIFDGIVRSTFLIGKTGRILKVWRKVKVDGHASEVLAAAKAANASQSVS